jgi:hypothetical protein
VAPGEADALCAQMVLKHKAHACMSDDTDMFVYGCPRVLRHINLFDETMTMYNMTQILALLGMTMTEFRQICVVSGTDYTCTARNNVTTFHLHFKLTLQLFKQYKKCAQDASETNDVVAADFYTWLHHNCSAFYPHPHLKFDYNAMTAINDMFDTTNVKLPLLNIQMKANRDLLRNVMAHENFIFVD